MTVEGELRTMAMHEFRDKGRLAVGFAQAGSPVMVFQHGDPAAVLVSGREAERWIAIERAFSALHGLGVYPELAIDTSTLAELVAGREQPPAGSIRRLARQRREILEIPRTIGIAEIQRRLAGILKDVGEGKPTAIVSGGSFAAYLITATEFYRLRALSRVVAWFRTAGLDLAAADEIEMSTFVRRFREGRLTEAEAAG